MKAYLVVKKETAMSEGDIVISPKLITKEKKYVFYANSKAHLERILEAIDFGEYIKSKVREIE